MGVVERVLFGASVVSLLATSLLVLQLARGLAGLARLRDRRVRPLVRTPWVSILVAARNEERNIEAGLRSLLVQEYPRLEVIVVDDRSTDGTGAIVDRLAGEFPQLRAIHIRELPPGWLGKNHALHQAALQAHGELLLFTDADVVMHPTLVQLAVQQLLDEQLDHLTLLLEARVPGWLLRSFIVAFVLFFTCFTRPWRVRDPRSTAHVGVGAFNLVRRETYRRLGGHRPLALRPDDDLKLGKLIKLGGGRQDVADGVGLIHVPWYGSLGEAIVGLEKNTFAAVEYRVLAVLGSCAALFYLFVWPPVALAVVGGVAWWLNLAACLLLLALAWRAAASVRLRPWHAAGLPLATLLFIYINLRSMSLALWRGGIRWRDTFYPLAELRGNRV